MNINDPRLPYTRLNVFAYNTPSVGSACERIDRNLLDVTRSAQVSQRLRAALLVEGVLRDHGTQRKEILP
jgi:hypothetical protein